MSCPPAHALRCYQCPEYERHDATKCLKNTEVCDRDLKCFFEYRGKWINLGCGKYWEKPAGCHGDTCIHWCHRNLCNRRLLRKAPFDIAGVEQDDGESSGSGGILSWLFNSTAELTLHPALSVVWMVVISKLLSM